MFVFVVLCLALDALSLVCLVLLGFVCCCFVFGSSLCVARCMLFVACCTLCVVCCRCVLFEFVLFVCRY